MDKSQRKQSQAKNNQANEKQLTENPRWLYIRIKNVDLTLISEKNQKKQEQSQGLIIMELGDKKSSSEFKLQRGKYQQQKIIRQLKEETHLFCYEAEQILTIKLLATKMQQKQQNNGEQQMGYSKVVVTPFVLIPYTRHKVLVNLVKMKQDKSIQVNSPYSTLELQIYYFLNFSAKIQITPLYGKFTRNTAVIGTMRLCCIFTLNGQRKKSLIAREGGIYPNWAKQSQKIKNSESAQRLPKQLVNNKFSFNMNSVGHILTIQVVNFPLLDKDAELVGKAEIRIESHNFLTKPNKQVLHNEKNSIKLQYYDYEKQEYLKAGQISLQSTFQFDPKSIRQELDSEESEEEQKQTIVKQMTTSIFN